MKEYLEEMKRLEIFSHAEQVFQSISIDKILSRVSESHSLSQNMQGALTKLINKRYNDFYEYIKTQNN